MGEMSLQQCLIQLGYASPYLLIFLNWTLTHPCEESPRKT
jgi:hypothetical protein